MWVHERYVNVTVPEICGDNTCQNNGECDDTQTGFRCNCTFGFIGLKCENGE